MKKNVPYFYMFVGLPGSGKSSFRDDLILKHSRDSRDTVVLSSDDYIEELAEMTGQPYSSVFRAHVDDAQKHVFENFQSAVKENENIIWDQTNLTKASRRKKMARLPKQYYKVCVLFDTDHNELNKVNEQRKQIGRDVPNKVRQHMIDTAEDPSLDEGFDQIITITR